METMANDDLLRDEVFHAAQTLMAFHNGGGKKDDDDKSCALHSTCAILTDRAEDDFARRDNVYNICRMLTPPRFGNPSVGNFSCREKAGTHLISYSMRTRGKVPNTMSRPKRTTKASAKPISSVRLGDTITLKGNCNVIEGKFPQVRVGGKVHVFLEKYGDWYPGVVIGIRHSRAATPFRMSIKGAYKVQYEDGDCHFVSLTTHARVVPPT